MQNSHKGTRPISALQSKPSMPKLNLSKTNAFKPGSAQQTEEFKKLTSKPFSTKKKDVSFQTQPTQDLQLTDLDSVRSSLSKLELTQNEKKQQLEAFMNESKDKYDFPENFNEVIEMTTSQVRSKKKVESDLESVYSNLSAVEFEFKKNSKKERVHLDRNLARIKELEALLAQKEEEYQNLVQSRLETEKSSIQEKESDRSMISDQSSQNNMFLTGVKEDKKIPRPKKPKQQPEEEKLEEQEKQPRQCIVGTNFMEINKVIQKREDKYRLTEEQQQRVEEILKNQQENIYHSLNMDPELDAKLQKMEQDLIQVIPKKEEPGLQPKDKFIIKQKEEIQLKKDAARLNEQLNVNQSNQNLAMENDSLEEKDKIQNCLLKLYPQLQKKEQTHFNEILDKMDESSKMVEKEMKTIQPFQPLPPVPQFDPLPPVAYPEYIQNNLKKIYNDQKDLLDQQISDLNQDIQKQEELEAQNQKIQEELKLALNEENSQPYQEQQIEIQATDYQEPQNVLMEDLDDVIQRIESKGEKEVVIPQELQDLKKIEEQDIEREEVEFREYDLESAQKELEKMGIDYQSMLEEIKQSSQEEEKQNQYIIQNQEENENQNEDFEHLNDSLEQV